MELFTENIPTGWTSTTPTAISQVTLQGRVHSGDSSVNIEDDGILTQVIMDINPGCFYEFSFFAHGEGSQVGITATVNFLAPGGDVLGGMIVINQMDLSDSDRSFGYYRIITTEAPNDATGVRIDFAVDAEGGQSADIDDVSFS